jgi:short subunit dehydrogenase
VIGFVTAHGGDMTTTLITGANKGLGLETTRRLIAAGHTVYAGTRDLANAGAAEAYGAIPVQLDVTDQDSVDKAIASLPELDVLINNAAVVGPSWTLDDLDVEAMRVAFETNVFGIVRVTQAALPLLRLSAGPVIVNVASGLGFPRALLDPRDDAYNGDRTDRAIRQEPAGNADQRLRPGLHRDRPEPAQRPPDRHRGHRRHRGAGPAGPGRPDRRTPQPPRPHRLLMSRGRTPSEGEAR